MKTCSHTDRMKVKMMILLFAILVLSSLKQGSAHVPDRTMHQENVAVRGKATQSSVFGSYNHAINAIDGNRNSNIHRGSCTHTVRETNPWWRVDLLHVYTITSVSITNRGDCEVCVNRIHGARILIGNSLENNGINNPECTVIGSLGKGETKTFHCPEPMNGRYVTLYIPRKEFLNFCEIEVNALLLDPQTN